MCSRFPGLSGLLAPFKGTLHNSRNCILWDFLKTHEALRTFQSYLSRWNCRKETAFYSLVVLLHSGILLYLSGLTCHVWCSFKDSWVLAYWAWCEICIWKPFALLRNSQSLGFRIVFNHENLSMIFTPTSLMLHTDFENRTMCQYEYVEVLEPWLWLLQFPVIEMMTHFSFKDLNLDNFSIFLNGHQTMLQCNQYSEVCCLCEIRTTVRNQCTRLHHFLACFYLCCIMLGRPCHCEMSLVQNPTEISTINIKYPLFSLYIYLFSYLRWSWS